MLLRVLLLLVMLPAAAAEIIAAAAALNSLRVERSDRSSDCFGIQYLFHFVIFSVILIMS